jgi:uncharacterized protein YbjT (DUF2867 family)
MSKRIIAVTGATGAQGGGLARAILADTTGEFTLRAITRKPESDAARALAAAGADVVAADLDDEASLQAAFAGAYGAYCLTNFWEHFSGPKETAQGRALAAAAGAAGIQHAIWSTFEDSRDYIPLADDRMPTLQGHYKVAHFDAKAEANAAFTDAGVPTTFLLTSAYLENFIYFGWGPQRTPDGSLAIVSCLADVKMPVIAVEDIGRCALGIFKRGGEYIGKSVGVAGDHLSGPEMAAELSSALGQAIAYNDVPADVYRSFGFPGADDVGNMFQFKRDCNEMYRSHRSVDESRRLNPDLQTLRTWLRANASRIPIPS